MEFNREDFGVMKFVKSLWFRLLVCVVCCVLFIAVPSILAHNTRSNGLGAGLYVITMLCGLPISSLLCGLLSEPQPQKLWILPALPTAVYFLCFPFLSGGYLLYQFAQFSGLIAGCGTFVLGILFLKMGNRKH